MKSFTSNYKLPLKGGNSPDDFEWDMLANRADEGIATAYQKADLAYRQISSLTSSVSPYFGPKSLRSDDFFDDTSGHTNIKFSCSPSPTGIFGTGGYVDIAIILSVSSTDEIDAISFNHFEIPESFSSWSRVTGAFTKVRMPHETVWVLYTTVYIPKYTSTGYVGGFHVEAVTVENDPYYKIVCNSNAGVTFTVAS